MTRALAFACFAAAAFAWTPGPIDRAGVAALGFAFMALSVGRAVGVARPATFRPKGPALFTEPEKIEPLDDEYLEQLEQLGREARAAVNGEGSTGARTSRLGPRITPE